MPPGKGAAGADSRQERLDRPPLPPLSPLPPTQDIFQAGLGVGGRGRGEDVRKLVADNEMTTLLDVLEHSSLDDSDGPAAVAAIQAVGLGDEHAAALLFRLGQKLAGGPPHPRLDADPFGQKLADPAGVAPAGVAPPGVASTAPPGVVSRAPTRPRSGGGVQNYEAIVQFFPASVWENTKTARSVEPMVNLGLRLGLRKPSPYTCQVLSCASQLHYKGVEACTAVPASARTDEVHLVAKMIKRKAATLPEPSEWLGTLPATPVELAAKHRDLFREVYGDDAANHPVQAVISLMDLEMLRSGTRCRHQKGSGGAVPMVLPTIPTGLEQFGATMLEHMNVLAQGMRDLQGNGSASGRRPAGTLRLESVRAAIADQSPRAREAQALGDAPSPWQVNLPAEHDSAGGGPTVEEVSAETPVTVAAPSATSPAVAPAPVKKARLSVAEASKLVLAGYVNKDKTAEEGAAALSAGKEPEVSKNPLGLTRGSSGLSSRFLV